MESSVLPTSVSIDDDARLPSDAFQLALAEFLRSHTGWRYGGEPRGAEPHMVESSRLDEVADGLRWGGAEVPSWAPLRTCARVTDDTIEFACDHAREIRRRVYREWHGWPPWSS